MKAEYLTLEKESLGNIVHSLPEYVTKRVGKPGYYAIGAFDENNELIGMTQFYVDATRTGDAFAEITYVYVRDQSRREGAGSGLLDRVNRILKKSNVPLVTVLVPASVRSPLKYDTSAKDTEGFFKSCGYIASKDSLQIYPSVIGDIFDGINDKNVKRYVSCG